MKEKIHLLHQKYKGIEEIIFFVLLALIIYNYSLIYDNLIFLIGEEKISKNDTLYYFLTFYVMSFLLYIPMSIIKLLDINSKQYMKEIKYKKEEEKEKLLKNKKASNLYIGTLK